MSGSQVFYMGDNGEVLSWDGTTIIETANYCVTRDGGAPVFAVPGVTGPVGEFDDPGPTGSTGYTVGPIDYDIGYAQAMKDVLIEIVRSGKGHLVQWLEARLKDLP